MTKKDIDELVAAKKRGSARRVWKRTGPTIGAIILFSILGIALGFFAVNSARDIDRSSLEARIESCERGNLMRASQRESSAVLIRLLDATAIPQSEEFRTTRANLVAYSAQNPNDLVARFALEATRNNHINTQAVDQAKEVLKEQIRELVPVDCEADVAMNP